MTARIPSPGSLFAGRYRVEAVLGSGGMGVVLAAIDEKTGVDCALKVLSAPELRADRARLVREARALMMISSPHVVRVFDVDEVDGVGPYMVLERLEGQDLGGVAPLGRPMPAEVVVGYAIQVCDALTAAHAVGIIHRDIKTSNLFLAKQVTGPPIVKVLDFGISKVGPGDGLGSLTNPAGPLGSPQFISPEQIESPRSVDVRTDIWSTGVVMYRLLSGAFPFSGSTVGETFALVLGGRRPALESLVPDAPPHLIAIVDRCLERDPEKRYPSARALREALTAARNEAHAISIDELTDQMIGLPPSIDLPTRVDPPRTEAPPSAVTFDSSSETEPVFDVVPFAVEPSVTALPRARRRPSRKVAALVLCIGVLIPLAVVAALRMLREPAGAPEPPAAPGSPASAATSASSVAAIASGPPPPPPPPHPAVVTSARSAPRQVRAPAPHRGPEPRARPELPPPSPPPPPEPAPGLRGNPYKP